MGSVWPLAKRPNNFENAPSGADLWSMNPDAQTTDHVFLPIILRAQIVACGLVLTAGAVVAGVGAVDMHALRALLGA